MRVGVRRGLRVEDSEAKLGVVVLAALEKPERIVGSLLGPCSNIEANQLCTTHKHSLCHSRVCVTQE